MMKYLFLISALLMSCGDSNPKKKLYLTSETPKEPLTPLSI